MQGREIAAAEIVGGVVDIAEMIPELRVDDRVAEGQIDHDMAYPHGEERTPESCCVKDDQKTDSEYELENHQRGNEKQPNRGGGGRLPAEHAVGAQETKQRCGRRREASDQQRIPQGIRKAIVRERALVPSQTRSIEGRHRQIAALEREQ